jgi:macrolide-specific efflux system membrane fusion protein
VDVLPEKVPDVFRSGMSAVVEIVEASKENVLCLPLEAVRRTKRGGKVLLAQGNGKTPVEQKVALGIADDKNVEIVSGLTTNDTVVIRSAKKKLPKAAPAAGRNPFMPAPRERRR